MQVEAGRPPYKTKSFGSGVALRRAGKCISSIHPSIRSAVRCVVVPSSVHKHRIRQDWMRFRKEANGLDPL